MSYVLAPLLPSSAQDTAAKGLSTLRGYLNLAGLTQTSDSGQTNADSSLGYQIWRFNDTLQSTAPIYFKLWYQTASNVMQVIVGTGSDGAGNITGLQTTLSPAGANLGVASIPLVFMGAPNRLMMQFTCYGGVAQIVSIERSHDSLGVDTASGVLMMVNGVYTSVAQATAIQYLDFTNNQVGRQCSSVVLPAPSGVVSLQESYTNKIGVLPAIPITKTGITNPGDNILFFYNSDLVAYNAIPITVYSGVSTVTYLPVPSVTTGVYRWGAPTSLSLLLRVSA